jgi:hypothetical protein
MGYNLVLRARAAFLMYSCGSSSFKCVCNLVGMIFLGLIISFSCGSIFLRQYEHPLLVVRERCVSLFTLGVDVSFFFVFSFLNFYVPCGGLVSDLEYKQCGMCSPCHLVLVLFRHGVLLVFFLLLGFHHVCFLWGGWFRLGLCCVGPCLATEFHAGWEG